VVTQGSTISELADIPETSVSITRGTLVLEEWGNSIPYTGKLEALSEFSAENLFTVALRNDMAKTIDLAVATELKTTKTLYIPTSAAAGSFDDDGTASTTAAANLSIFHVKEIVDALKTGQFGGTTMGTSAGNPVPPYDGENYISIAAVKALRGLKDDPDWEEAIKYADPERFLTGEVGRFYSTRFIETNNTNALSNGVGTNSVLGEAIFMGADSIVEGVAIPEEVRVKIPVKYGRDKGIAWYALLGFKLVWSLTADKESHVVYVTSA
jgi:N4-gp56 family major capsid protein